MAGSAVLTLAEMQRIQPYRSEYTTRRNIFYFPVVDSLASHIIKSLLFRLENLVTPSYIVLGDARQVSKRDIESGAFVDGDEGKSRSLVLSERYGGSFSTTVINETSKREEHTYIGSGSTTFVVSTGGEKEYTDNIFTGLVRKTNRTGEEGKVNLFLIEAFFNGEDAILRTRIGSGGIMHGSSDKTIVRNSGIALAEQYVRNSMLGQMVFNLVNSIVTEDMTFNYSKIQGKVKQGEIRKEYLKRRDRNSIYRRVDVQGLNLLTKEADEVDKSFLEFESERGAGIARQVDKFFSSSEGASMLGYAQLVKVNLQNKMPTFYQDELKEWMLVNELIVRTHRDITSSGGTLSKYQVYMTLIAYVESRIGAVFGDS